VFRRRVGFIGTQFLEFPSFFFSVWDAMGFPPECKVGCSPLLSLLGVAWSPLLALVCAIICRTGVQRTPDGKSAVGPDPRVRSRNKVFPVRGLHFEDSWGGVAAVWVCMCTFS